MRLPVLSFINSQSIEGEGAHKLQWHNARMTLLMCMKNVATRSGGIGAYSESWKGEPVLFFWFRDKRSVDHDLDHVICGMEYARLVKKCSVQTFGIPSYYREDEKRCGREKERAYNVRESSPPTRSRQNSVQRVSFVPTVRRQSPIRSSIC
jgi:hypothetical protein